MKQYIKDGKIKYRNQIVIKKTKTIKDKDGNDKVIITNTYNPKENDIFADGWEEYVTPAYERTIEDYRRDKITDINRYDSSTEVNEFFLGETSIWLDKATRSGLMLRFESELKLGDKFTTLWYDGIQYPLELTVALNMLYMIEKYASKCYDNTQLHLSNVSKLETIEDIQNYDYRTGYPEKLRF